MILIDSRIGSRDLSSPWFEQDGIPRELAESLDADIVFEGKGPDGAILVGIERKNVRDLITSIRTNRLADVQIPRMQKVFGRHIWLIVEGTYKPGRDGLLEVPCNENGKKGWKPLEIGGSRFTFAELDNALTSFQMICGLHVKHSYSDRETSKIINDLFTWYQKPWDKHRAAKGFYQDGGPVTIWEPTLLRRMLAQIDGLGAERGDVMAQQFSSPRDMVNAPVERWIVPGAVSKARAKEIDVELGPRVMEDLGTHRVGPVQSSVTVRPAKRVRK